MRIKKFVAITMKDAIDQMRKELGSEAIILNTRTVTKGGVLNFLGKEEIELTAAVDDDAPSQQLAPPARSKRDPFGAYVEAARAEQSIRRPEEKNQATLEALRNVAEHFEQRSNRTRPVSPQALEQADIVSLKSEIEDIKSTLHDIAEHMKYSRMPVLPNHLKESFVRLVENDVEEELAADLVQSVYGKLNDEQLQNKNLTEKHLMHSISTMFKSSETGKTKRKGTRVIALVGPTGVGKTTTIAKLAAINKLMNNLNVAMISTDTYRIGAIEQLRTFASIADIPMEVVYKPSEVAAALRKFKDKDIVFIDTVGRSQRKKKDLMELKKFIEAAAPDETHLVLSAATSAQTLLDATEQFKIVKPNRILFSKLDEAATYGSLLSLSYQQKLPISYVTTGQVVPDDILVADSTKLASMIFHGTYAHA